MENLWKFSGETGKKIALNMKVLYSKQSWTVTNKLYDSHVLKQTKGWHVTNSRSDWPTCLCGSTAGHCWLTILIEGVQHVCWIHYCVLKLSALPYSDLFIVPMKRSFLLAYLRELSELSRMAFILLWISTLGCCVVRDFDLCKLDDLWRHSVNVGWCKITKY